MHNVTADQIERNKQLIALVKNYPQIYNHDPTMQSGESLDDIWKGVGQEMGEPGEIEFQFFDCLCLYELCCMDANGFTFAVFVFR